MIGPHDLARRMIAAVPVPFDTAGRVDRDAQARYVEHMSRQPVDGVAVWAHTGRGLHLSRQQREEVLLDWRTRFGGARPLIAAAGAALGSTEWESSVISARAMAAHAAGLGADALLVYPPRAAGGRPDEERRLVEYHVAVASEGLPIILFFLYEGAGGLTYSPAVLSELLAMPSVVGIKVATLDSVMTFQDVAGLVSGRFPDKILMSGEDRFLGYSLMCGATAALIGMAAACTSLQAALFRSYRENEPARFLALNAEIDRFAQGTFLAPLEGYIQRMLWCLVHEGVIPPSSAHDPWAPELPPDEFDRLGRLLAGLRSV